MSNCHVFGTWGRWRPGLYAVILAPVLQVPAGKEGGPGGLPNVRKEEKNEKDEEEKNEDDNDKKEMEGKRRDNKFYRSLT